MRINCRPHTYAYQSFKSLPNHRLQGRNGLIWCWDKFRNPTKCDSTNDVGLNRLVCISNIVVHNLDLAKTYPCIQYYPASEIYHNIFPSSETVTD